VSTFQNFVIREIDADAETRSKFGGNRKFQKFFSKFFKRLTLIMSNNNKVRHRFEEQLRALDAGDSARAQTGRAGQTPKPQAGSADSDHAGKIPAEDLFPEPPTKIPDSNPGMDILQTATQAAIGFMPSMEDFLDSVDNGGDVSINGVIMDGLPGILAPIDINSGGYPNVVEAVNTRGKTGKSPAKKGKAAKAKKAPKELRSKKEAKRKGKAARRTKIQTIRRNRARPGNGSRKNQVSFI
jgi:hypothetical protein